MGKKKKKIYESEEESERGRKKKYNKKKTGKKHVIEKKKTKTKTKKKIKLNETKSQHLRHETSSDNSQYQGRNNSRHNYRNAKKKKKTFTKIPIDNSSDGSLDEQDERVSYKSATNGDGYFRNKTTKKSCFKKFMLVYIIFIVVIIIIGIANYQYFVRVIQNIKILEAVTTTSETSTAKPDPQKPPDASAVVSENTKKESKEEPENKQENKPENTLKKEEEETKTEKQEQEKPEKEQQEKETPEKEALLENKTPSIAEEYDVSSADEKLPEYVKKLSEITPVKPKLRDYRYFYDTDDPAYVPESIDPSRILELSHIADPSTEDEITKTNEEKQNASEFTDSSRLNKDTTVDEKIKIDKKEQDHIDTMNKINFSFFMPAYAQPVMRSRNRKKPPPDSDDLDESTISNFRNKTKVERVKRDVNKNRNEVLDKDVDEEVEEDVEEEKKEIIIPPEIAPLFEPITISLESNENPNHLYYSNIPPRYVTEKLIYQFFREQRKKKKIIYFSTSIDFNEDAFKLKFLEKNAVEDSLKRLKLQEIISSEEGSGFLYTLKKMFGFKKIKDSISFGVFKNVENIAGFSSEDDQSKSSTSTRLKRLIKIGLTVCVVQVILVYCICSCFKGMLKMVIMSICKMLICCCCGGKDKKEKSDA